MRAPCWFIFATGDRACRIRTSPSPTIVFLVVQDFYHRYTVDEHTLVAIEKLAELAESKDAVRLRFAEILSEIENLALLRFALLFHDTGKGSNTGNHSHRSVELVRQAMQRLEMPAEERATA